MDERTQVENPFAVPESFDAAQLLPPSELEPYKADRGARFLGALVDNLISLAVGVPFAVAGVMLAETPEDIEALGQIGLAVGYLLLAPVHWYLIVTRGQSVGKLAVGTRIVTQHGAPVDFMTGVVLRSWVIMVAAMCVPFASLIDALLIFQASRQCGHDLIAKTIVVDASSYDPYTSG
jgi:uncharacterized RDD family membrane protein YckC